MQDVPDEIVAICSDVLHNLRSALDHLACHLVSSTGKSPGNQICFPIAESAEEYASPRFRRKVEGMRKEAIDAIDAIKPHKGRNDTLWRLHNLDRIDKHRLLLTIETAHRAHSMTPSERARMKGIFIGSHPGQPAPDLSGLWIQAKPIRILKTGDVVRTIPKSEVEQQMQFHFDIALSEVGIAETEPIVETLHQMSNLLRRSFSGSGRGDSWLFGRSTVSSLLRGILSGESPKTFRQERNG